MKLYLSGPIRGYPLYNFPAFDHAQDVLEKQGHSVFSPAQMDRDIGFDEHTSTLDDFDFGAAVLRDVKAIVECEAIVMLDGWPSSKGATLEKSIAEYLRKWVFLWDSLRAPGGRVLHGPLAPVPSLGAESTMSPKPKPETVLEEAARLVDGDRNKAYGHPRDDFACIAKMWNAYLVKRLESEMHLAVPFAIKPRDVAMMMILVKVARDANGARRDNGVDIAGYCRCAERLEEKPK